MREIRTSGLTSGDWKRGGILIVHQPATAPVIDPTRRLTAARLRCRYATPLSSAAECFVRCLLEIVVECQSPRLMLGSLHAAAYNASESIRAPIAAPARSASTLAA